MSNGRYGREPRVPDSEPADLFVSPPAFGEVFGDTENLLLGPDEPSFSALLTAPATIPASVISYAMEGESGLSRVETLLRKRAADLDQRKFSKWDSYYLPQTPIPFGVWEYKCETCRFYNDRSRSSSRKGYCDIVGQRGDPLGGQNVHPEAWCAFWMPQENTDWFEYVSERFGEA